ncbi:MAG: hypothetical protein JO116_03490 [Planctomycetaceae bacterium]|nr:hypothetical protein [Planctomycetaceae bacterium]
MRTIMSMLAGMLMFMSAILPESHADSIVELPIKSISLTIPSIDLRTATGLVPTGPITVSLQSGKSSVALFDVTNQTVATDQFFQFNFPLLNVIHSPPPTLEFQENGPVTVGVNPSTGAFVALGNLRGGGTFDNNGSVFSNALMFVNDATNIFAPNNPPLPPQPTPPVPFPAPFTPFPPPSLPDPRPLPDGFLPATTSEVLGLLDSKTTVMSSFSISGIFRSPTQTGDIPFSAMGHLGPIPEPSSVVMLATGLLGLLGYGWWHRTRATA